MVHLLKKFTDSVILCHNNNIIIVTHIWVLKDNFFEGVVVTHGKGRPEVRSDGNRGVATSLKNTLSLPLESLDVPFINGSIHTATDQPSIIRVPHDATNLYMHVMIFFF